MKLLFVFLFWLLKADREVVKLEFLIQGKCLHYSLISYNSFTIHSIKTPTLFGKYVCELPPPLRESLVLLRFCKDSICRSCTVGKSYQVFFIAHIFSRPSFRESSSAGAISHIAFTLTRRCTLEWRLPAHVWHNAGVYFWIIFLALGLKTRGEDVTCSVREEHIEANFPSLWGYFRILFVVLF